MLVETPIEIKYLVNDRVRVDDLIESLAALKDFIENSTLEIPSYFEGVNVEKVEIFINTVSQESPLREVFFVSVFLALQDKLEAGVTEITKKHLDITIPQNLQAFVALLAVMSVLYGASALHALARTQIEDSKTKKLLRNMISDMSIRTGHDKNEIERKLRERYAEPGTLKKLGRMAIGLLRPSINQNSAPIIFHNIEIPRNVVKEMPNVDVVDDERKANRFFENVTVEIHAQDRDRQATGWAARIEGITKKRVPMKLFDGVKPSDLWGRNTIVGDVIVIFKEKQGVLKPTEIHLTNVAK